MQAEDCGKQVGCGFRGMENPFKQSGGLTLDPAKTVLGPIEQPLPFDIYPTRILKPTEKSLEDAAKEVKFKLNPVVHPPHYGGKEDVYEAIKVINAWNLNFNLGNVLKYIRRRKEKNAEIENLKKARFYLDYEIQKLEKGWDI